MSHAVAYTPNFIIMQPIKIKFVKDTIQDNIYGQ